MVTRNGKIFYTFEVNFIGNLVGECYPYFHEDIVMQYSSGKGNKQIGFLVAFGFANWWWPFKPLLPFRFIF